MGAPDIPWFLLDSQVVIDARTPDFGLGASAAQRATSQRHRHYNMVLSGIRRDAYALERNSWLMLGKLLSITMSASWISRRSSGPAGAAGHLSPAS